MAMQDITVRIAADLRDFANGMNEVQSRMSNMGQKLSSTGTAMATTFGAAGGAIAAGLGLAVNKSMDFEAQVSRVGAISGATGSELQALRDSALQLGASTSKSASEVAVGQEALAALGMTATEVVSAMPGVISAAESSGADMAQTAEVMASALNIFGLEASESSRVADILAQTANQSAADIGDMGYALKYAGPVAANLGVSMEELSASIGIMTNAGLDGSSAGTALRAGLLSLLKPSNANQKVMDSLGLSMTDANGKFIGLKGVVEQLNGSMDGMTNAQKTATLASLVGTEASSGFLALMAAGPGEIDKMTTSLENSGGASATAAAAMKDNLKGALEELGGAFETAQITIGTALTPAIQTVVAVLQGLMDKFNGLSPSMQSFIATGAAVTAGVLLLVAGLGGILVVAGAVASGIAALGGAAAILAGALAVITSPVTLVIAGLVALGAAFVVLYNKSETFRAGVTSTWEAIKSAAMSVFNFIKPFVMQAMDAVGAFIGQKLAEIKTFWDENGTQILQAVTNAWNMIKTAISTAIAFLAPIFQAGFMVIVSVVKSTWDAIKNVINGALDIIKGVVKVFTGAFTGDFSLMWSGIKQIFTGALQLIWGVVNLYLVGKLLGPLKTFASMGKSVITGAWSAIKSVFTSSLSAIRSGVASGFNAAKSVITGAMSSIRSAVSSAWSAVKSSISSAVGSIKSSISSGFSTAKSIVSNAMSAIKSVISSVWSAVKSVISSAMSAIKSVISSGFNAAKSVVSSVINAIKSVITNGFNNAKSAVQTATNAIKALVTGDFNALKGIVSGAMSNVKNAIVNGWNSAKSFLSGINLSGIGKNIIQGLINGIGSMAGAVASKISSIADGIKSKITGALGIHSPSRWMKDNVGKHIPSGIAVGMQANAKAATAAAAKLTKSITEQMKNAEVKFDTKKLSASAYIAELRKIDAAHKLTGDQQRKLNSEIYAAQQVVKKQNAEALKDKSDFYKKLDSINDSFVEKSKKVASDLKATEAKLTADFNKEFADRKRSIMNFTSLFDTVEKKAIDPAAMVNGLKTQVAAIKTYNKSIEDLRAKGLSDKLMDELQAQGPSGAAELEALTKLNSEQLAQYQHYYNAKRQLAQEQAKKETADEKAELAAKVKAEEMKAKVTVLGYRNEWMKQIAALKSATVKSTGGLSPGMKDAGKQAIAGMIKGMDSMKGPLASAAEQLAKLVAATTKKTLNIHSPSRVMEALGGFTGEGMANGIAKSRSLVEKAVHSLSSAAQAGVAIQAQTNGTYALETTGTPIYVENVMMMDGREIGRVVQPYVDQGQQSKTQIKSYFGGNR
ncbi:phage tail tape measure protein [Exiguobacterium oxidotolerans]|uniref:phage tail tape measure protein n=1 Tax=Exiguobacterium oxidotolerans TaxID=223958 RepID=UPI0005522304|nr:phage tail tape measure protein [Exiguobacterium oxidotolerans]